MNEHRKLYARLPHGAVLFLVLLAAAFAVGRLTAPRAPEPAAPADAHAHAAPEPKAAATPAWWTCAMHPQIRQPKPGLCPLCNMELIPLKEEADTGATGLRSFVTSEAARKLMDLQTSPVERKFVPAVVRMVGKVDYDETRLATISAWVPGRLDRLYVDYTGITVRQGDHMVYLYSPELYATQEELLQALRAVKQVEGSQSQFVRETALGTVRAARDKLRLLGLTKEQIAGIEQSGTPSDHLTIFAPIGGVVLLKHAQQGMYVQTGEKIYTIADLSRVWVKLDAYESDLAWLRYGQKVTFTAQAYPGQPFEGKIAFMDPVLNPMTRTVKVRVNVPNEDGRLKPEMFVHAVAQSQVAAGGRVMEPDLAGKWMCPMHPEVIRDQAGKCSVCEMPLVKTESLGYVAVNEVESARPLVIPATAPLLTGTRAVVYVQVPQAKRPTFEGREIVLGERVGDYYIVRHGLAEGELVVTSGNFKIDSSLQILARPSMMSPGGAAAAGHEHAPAAPAKKAGEPTPPPTSKLPPGAAAQLRDVQAAYATLVGAARTDALGPLRAAYRGLGDALDRVDAAALPDDLRPLWKELAMLLKNDSVVGGEVKDLQTARQELALLEEHLARLHDQLGLPRLAADVLRTVETPPAFQAQLRTLLDAYFALQAALAGDDLKASQEAIAPLGLALDAVDMKGLKDQAHLAWMRELPSVRKGLEDARKAKDLAGLRAAFALLSEEMPTLIRLFRLAADRPVYLLQCPMAFNDRGATWLQRDPDVRNPYFGAAMLKCGSVLAPLGEARPAPQGASHERHQ